MLIHIQHKAREDLKQVYKKSLREWGIVRADSYYDALVTAINGLAEFPELGFARNDIKSGYRQLSAEKHHIKNQQKPIKPNNNKASSPYRAFWALISMYPEYLRSTLKPLKRYTKKGNIKLERTSGLTDFNVGEASALLAPTYAMRALQLSTGTS